jgi:hypothetical protein
MGKRWFDPIEVSLKPLHGIDVGSRSASGSPLCDKIARDLSVYHSKQLSKLIGPLVNE